MTEHSTTAAAPTRQRTKIRADIQALRAIAVMLVVFNHIWPMRVSGGFVGVDVFFVISGYLITAHLLGEIRRTDTVSLSKFYVRRAKRLLPAALLVGVVTLVATLIWIPAERWSRIAKEIFASAAYFENWMLTASAVNYSDRGQAATPAQHYWSLSVEEQFYLLWPLTLLVVSSLLARRYSGRITARPGVLIAYIVALGAASFAFSMWQTDVQRAAAYFNTFGRAWEFMLGALIAAASPMILNLFKRHPLLNLRGIAQLAGYGMILLSALRFDDATVFPGPWALVPVAGTALVIVAGPEMPKWTPARLLAWRPVQYVGDISYSLYLWHWPVIVIVPFVLAREVRMIDRLAMLALSFLLAILTKYFVEDPGRTTLFANAPPRRTLFATLATIAVVALFSASTVWGAGVVQAREQARIDAAVGSDCFGAATLEPTNNCDDPFGPALFPAGAESDAPWNASAPECGDVVSDESWYTNCDFGTDPVSKDQFRVWLVGDSHAEHWQATIFEIARANGWQLSKSMRGGCPTVPIRLQSAFSKPVTPEKQEVCLSWAEDISTWITEDAPDLVIISNFSSTEIVEDGSNRPLPDQLADGMSRSFTKWADLGTQIIVIRDVPTAGTTLGAACVSLLGANASGCVAAQDDVLPPDPMVEAITVLDDPRITSIDLTNYFCQDNVCSGVIGSLPVFFDRDHLSSSYARTLVPMLSRELSIATGHDFVAVTGSDR